MSPPLFPNLTGSVTQILYSTVSLSPGFASSGSPTYFLALPVKDNTLSELNLSLFEGGEGYGHRTVGVG